MPPRPAISSSVCYALKLGLEIVYPPRDEEWGIRRFMLREPSGTTVNIVSHRAD